jgi:hypothetical protein
MRACPSFLGTAWRILRFTNLEKAKRAGLCGRAEL